MKRAIVVCLGLLAPVCPAAADSPVAVVEEIQGKVTGAEFMDYVTPKSVIKIEGGGATFAARVTGMPFRRLTASSFGNIEIGSAFAFSQLSDDSFRPNGLRGRTLVVFWSSLRRTILHIQRRLGWMAG